MYVFVTLPFIWSFVSAKLHVQLFKARAVI